MLAIMHSISSGHSVPGLVLDTGDLVRNKTSLPPSRRLQWGVDNTQINPVVRDYMRDTIWGCSCGRKTWTMYSSGQLPKDFNKLCTCAIYR